MGLLYRDLSKADWRAIVAHAGHRGMHNFSVGTLDAYFNLTTPKEIEWLDECVLHIVSPQGRHKTWVFDVDELMPNISLLQHLQTYGPIYSQFEMTLPSGRKFNETVYDLDDVFAREQYTTRKKFYQRTVYPERWFDQHDYDLRILTPEWLPSIAHFHDDWVDWKMKQPETFKIMFPKKRYYECCRFAADDAEDVKNYLSFVAVDQEGLIAGVRILYREAGYVFDLANFTAAWRLPSNFSEHFTAYTMKIMHDEGIMKLNSGSPLNKSLSAFKDHWPHSHITHWAYGQQK